VNIIIPVYVLNEEILQLTKNTIESLSGHLITIIDNGSPMGGGYLRSVADTYIRNQTNLGYAKAVNQGIKLLNNEFVAISNNDVRPSKNWDQVARGVFADNDKTYSCHFRMTNYEEPYQYGTSVVYEGKERWCTASFFVVKNPELYDEQFINSYDDWHYFMTARDKGLKTAYTNLACYQHHHSSTQKLIPTREEQNTKNREHFKRLWGEYPEDRFARMYPEQMEKDYWSGFSL